MVVVVLAGCSADPLASSDPWASPRPLGATLEAYRPPASPDDAEPSADGFEDPTGELSLRGAMALAVARSPRLRAFAWDVRRAEARALQAGLWSNPELEGEIENFGGTDEFSGTDAAETTVSIAQTFPLGGDIDRRKALAQIGADLAGWDYEAARIDVLTEVTKRYVSVLSAERRIEVAREALSLAERVQTTTQRRVDAGDAPPLEAVRASVPVANAQVTLRRAERQLAASRTRLAMTWGSSQPRFRSLTGSLTYLASPPPADRLVALLNENPAVARWAAEISAHRAEAELAQAEATPDLTGRLGYRYDDSDNSTGLVVGLSLPLPVFDRRQGDVLAARLGAASARERQREATLRLETMLSVAYGQLANAYDEATAIRDVALPPATEAFEVTRRAFENADLSLIDLLDAQRTLFDLQTRQVDALIDYHQAAAEIESLIGRRLSDLDDHQPLPETSP